MRDAPIVALNTGDALKRTVRAGFHLDLFPGARVHRDARLGLDNGEASKAWKAEPSIPLDVRDNSVNQIVGGRIGRGDTHLAGGSQNIDY